MANTLNTVPRVPGDGAIETGQPETQEGAHLLEASSRGPRLGFLNFSAMDCTSAIGSHTSIFCPKMKKKENKKKTDEHSDTSQP